MYNKQLMDPKTRDLFEKTAEAISVLKVQHKELIAKAKNGTISTQEKVELNHLIKLYQKLEKLRTMIWDSHSLVKIALKNMK